MKRLMIMIIMLTVMLTIGCGGEAPKEGVSVKLGLIRHLNATETQMEELLTRVQEEEGVGVVKYAATYYDSLKLMQMGLESGSVEQMSVYSAVADYLMAQVDNYAAAEDKTLKMLSDDFCLAVRAQDVELKGELDKAISELKADGTLDALIEKYIKEQETTAVEMPTGGEVLKVAVTGDLPPLDYVSAEGKAAGFNTALLAELGKRLNRSVEIIAIESGARAAALSSGQVDVVFWVAVPRGDNMPKDIDAPENIILSEPYFKDDVKHLKLKK